MSNDYPRHHRVADFIQRELALILREVKDPRISPMLTISAVDVSKDLSVAKVFFTLIDAEERADTEEGLGRASGFLRKKLGSALNMRAVPSLRFYYDESTERGALMSKLIDDAVASNTTETDAENNSTVGGDEPKA